MADTVSGWFLSGLIGAYVVVLFVVARRADARTAARSPALRAIAYSLSLATLCSSWTYFAAVGLAIDGNWLFIANFVGPILMITLGHTVWRRIALVCKQENVGSIGDFLSARYGKSRALGSLVAIVASIAALPYIALQFISLTKAWAFVAKQSAAPSLAMPILVMLLAGFAILFGARRPSLTQHGRGLTNMISIEAAVKLVGLLSVSGLAGWLLLRTGSSDAATALSAAPARVAAPLSLATATLICMASAVTLPRQFHVGFVALEDAGDTRTARWLFPVYMTLWMLAVIPIAMAARAGLAPDGIDRDMVVLGLPMQHGGTVILAIACLGGFSAGAAMVVVETVALSAMVSNELILPWLARTRWSALRERDAGQAILLVRRATMILILLLAWLYYHVIQGETGLTELGFTSLAASAQLMPALMGAVLWRRGQVRGAVAGILVGMTIWLLTVVGPGLAVDLGFAAPFGMLEAWGFEGGILLSFSANTLAYVAVSLRTRPRLIDEIQANIFVASRSPALQSSREFGNASVGDLRGLIARFVGEGEARRLLLEAGQGYAWGDADDDLVTPVMARSAERILSGVIGASSARNVIAMYLAADTHDVAEISQILDEAAHAVQFSRELLQITLDNMEHGLCVFDRGRRLVVWNQRFVELLGLAPAAVQVGTPIDTLLSAADIDRAVVERRVGAIAARERFAEERAGADGAILRVVGTPIVSGDYLINVSDVSDARRAAQTLADMNEVLERRVAERTAELTEANAIAERAMRTQRRFIAAASHDLLQPLHAARLFIATAAEDVRRRPTVHDTLGRADLSLDSADRLLKALLNLSRLEVEGLRPSVRAVNVAELLDELDQELAPIARQRGVALMVRTAPRWILSDRDLLRSVLQNLLTNAIRYTPDGRVLLACRPDGDGLRIEVRDNGVGIAEDMIPRVFQEFYRVPGGGTGPGAGLGLSIAERICDALGHRIDVRSRLGAGSVFAVYVPLTVAPLPDAVVSDPATALAGLTILCVDDDPEVLLATRVLLERWGVTVETAAGAQAALDLAGPWDVAIVDHHLGTGATGLDVLTALRSRARTRLLITANASDDVTRAAAAAGIGVMRKPLAPPVLRAFLGQLRTVEVFR